MNFPKALLLVILLPVSVAAETHPLLDAKFMLMGGQFRADQSLKLSVGGAIYVPGRRFDYHKALRDSGDDESFALEGRWRFRDRWFAAVQYFEFSDSAGALLEDDIYWDDLVFQAGLEVNASARLRVTRLFFGYDLARTDRHAFGVGGGLHELQAKFGISGEAFIDGQSIGDTRASATATGPLPNFGAWYTWAAGDRLALTGRVDWLSAAIGAYDGTIINASAGLNFKATRHIGLGLNYNLFQLDVDVDDSDWVGELDLRYRGPYLYVSAYW